jgi:hypothetical protein
MQGGCILGKFVYLRLGDIVAQEVEGSSGSIKLRVSSKLQQVVEEQQDQNEKELLGCAVNCSKL